MNTSKGDRSTLNREGESFQFRGEEIISVITDYRVLQMFHICSQDVFLLLIMTNFAYFYANSYSYAYSHEIETRTRFRIFVLETLKREVWRKVGERNLKI